MRLVELQENKKTEYNRFVMEHESGSFLQSYEWGEWQKNLGREVHRFFLTSNNESITSNPSARSGSGGNQNHVIASIQLVKMPLPFGRYYLYAPYGPVVDGEFPAKGGSAFGGKIEDLRFLIQQISEKFSDAVFIRIEPKYHPFNSPPKLGGGERSGGVVKSTNIQPGKTLIIDLLKTEENLLSEMHPKTRYNIRLAQKHGVEVQKDLAVTPGYGLYFKEVINQILETEKRQEYKGHGEDYYKKMVDFFALHNQGEIKINIYKALQKNELLASAIILDFSAKGGSASGGGIRTYLFGGSSENHKNLMAPYALHWKAMQDAKSAGMDFYDFWGIETSSGKTPGFARFKQGFGGKTLEYSGAFDIPIKRKSFWLYRIARRLRF